MNKTVFKKYRYEGDKHSIDRGQTQPFDHQDNPRLTFVVIIKTMKL